MLIFQDCVQFYYFVLYRQDKKDEEEFESENARPFKVEHLFCAFCSFATKKIDLHYHPLLRRHPSSSQPAAGGGGGGKDQFVIHLLAEKKRIVGNIGIPIVVRFCSI